MPKPIIAAINGPCAGIGLVQALMCDIRFVAEDAKLTTAFARRGLVAEHGISWVLPRLVGPARALDLLLSGASCSGARRRRWAWSTRAMPPETVLEQTLAYARDLARQLLAGEHGDDEAPGLLRAAAAAAARRWTRPTG